jgi:hypothetical protein
MAVLELSPHDLAMTRFAVSPMAELTGALHVLGGRYLPPGLDGWAAAPSAIRGRTSRRPLRPGRPGSRGPPG